MAVDQAIETLSGATELQDPTQILQLFLNSPDTLPAATVDKIWRVAVKQSALADLRLAKGELHLGEWQRVWHQVEELLRTTMVKSMPAADLERLTTAFREATRAIEAFPDFAMAARQLENALKYQRAVIAFHWDDEENSYRRKENELSARIADALTPDGQRLAAAKQLIDHIDRYRNIYIPRLQDASWEVERADKSCEPLLTFFSKTEYTDVWRWSELTRTVVDARKAAVEHIAVSLECDMLMPNEVASGGMVLSDIDGKPTPVLSKESTARFKEYAVKMAACLEEAQKEGQTEPERQSALDRLAVLSDRSQRTEAPLVVADTSPLKKRRTSHPVQRKPLYRLGKIVWSVGLLLWCAVSAVVAPTTEGVITGWISGALLFYGIRSVIFYIWLGRPTLYERPGSGYVDLDVLEEEILDNSAAIPETVQQLKELRTRYGRRVPIGVVKGWSDRALEAARSKKQQVLLDADKQGTTVSIASLRQRLMSSAPGNIEPGDYRGYWERKLLRLEVEHGPEIPLSVVSELADSLDS